jgi:hypothetical protein
VAARILGLLASPCDVFAAARTCRLAHAASRAAGAFVRVDISALDAALAASRWAATLRGEPVRSSSAAQFISFLAGCDAAKGIRTLVLSRSYDSDADADGVCALVSRCEALERLLGLLAWSSAISERVLAAAAATPLRHTHVSGATRALLALPGLTSLYVSHHCQLDDGQPFDVAALEAVVAQGRLAQLELNIILYGVTPLVVRSATLRELAIGGKNLFVRVVECPRLTSFNMSDSWSGLYMQHANEDSVVCTAALAVIAGCPLVDWRAAPRAALPASLEVQHTRAKLDAQWPEMLRRRGDVALLRALEGDADAVRFAHALTFLPVVDGRLR